MNGLNRNLGVRAAALRFLASFLATGLLARLTTSGLIALAACVGPKSELGTSPWKSREVAEGVIWHRAEQTEVRGALQTVHVLEVDPANSPVICKPVALQPKARTSSMANTQSATAAINGGYFDSAGSPVGYLRIDERDIAQNPTSRPRGAVGFDGRGNVSFARIAPSQSWDGQVDALGAGPMLVVNGNVVVDFAAEGFTDAKFAGPNPRTAIGVSIDKRIYLVTVDGRQAGAMGMTLSELAEFMRGLGCADALNLDGGGSTTCWIRGKGAAGVVNHPSDTAGERAVANALAVFSRRVFIVDNDKSDAMGVDTPAGGFQALGEYGLTDSTNGEGYLGSNFVYGFAKARGQWTVSVDKPGRYEVFARWPRGYYTRTAQYKLEGVGKPQEVHVDQRAGSGQWIALGFVTLDPSIPLKVEVSSGDGEPFAADAIRVVEREMQVLDTAPAQGNPAPSLVSTQR